MSLTANVGLVAVTELCGRLGVIGAPDAAVGSVKLRGGGSGRGVADRYRGAVPGRGGLLTGLDRQRAGSGARQVTPVPPGASCGCGGCWPACRQPRAAAARESGKGISVTRLAGAPVTPGKLARGDSN